MQNIDQIMDSWFALENGDTLTMQETRKHIMSEASFFRNATYFTMSHTYDGKYGSRSAPSNGKLTSYLYRKVPT